MEMLMIKGDTKMTKYLEAFERVVDNFPIEEISEYGGYTQDDVAKDLWLIRETLEAFEEIQSIIDTWHTSHIMDNESTLREIDKIICEVLDNDKRISN